MKYSLALAILGLLAAPPAWSQMTPAPENELIGAEHAVKDAVIARDEAALRHLYADEFISTDGEGSSWTKDEDIAIDLHGASRLTSYTFDDVQVRVYGEVGVVTGRSDMRGTLNDRPESGEFRFTDVFVWRDGRWQCVAAHMTPVVRE